MDRASIGTEWDDDDRCLLNLGRIGHVVFVRGSINESNNTTASSLFDKTIGVKWTKAAGGAATATSNEPEGGGGIGRRTLSEIAHYKRDDYYEMYKVENQLYGGTMRNENFADYAITNLPLPSHLASNDTTNNNNNTPQDNNIDKDDINKDINVSKDSLDTAILESIYESMSIRPYSSPYSSPYYYYSSYYSRYYNNSTTTITTPC
jgi:hypothetical protein